MSIHHSCFKNPFEEKCQEVIWKDDLPYSNVYEDRFFQDDAVSEITNIFIEPNHLLKRIKNGSQIHIGELGFGFGLNFFVTAKFWFENNKNAGSHNLEYLAIDEALPTKAQILKIVDNFPEFKLDWTCTPATTNPLGTKGCGEAGAIAAPPAVMNAVMNAIGKEISMPATAEKVWRAYNENKKKNSEAA